MSQNKIQANTLSVSDFIKNVEHPTRQKDAFELLKLYETLTQQSARMWGSSMIGFGEYQYKTSKGKVERFFRSGFSPRKQNLSLYLLAGMSAAPDLLKALGKHKRAKSCLYINKLADVDLNVLEELIMVDWQAMNDKYPT
ncbi:DUF1801 domain-containing protein [Ningiella sp. W23]|uniref:DUF1801 domain-containing protein n=1 Tax=Ningiella sp. W23 TaxID=3023715 RepID=UPI003756DDC0